MKLAVCPRFSLILITLLSGLPEIAVADELSDLSDQCIAAVEAGDAAAFEAAADAIRKRKDVFNTEARKRAESCLSTGLGEPWEYYFPESAWWPVSEIRAREKARADAEVAERSAAIEAEAAAMRAEAAAMAAAAAEEAERRANAARVATLVYAACEILLARDQVAAMTNQLCVESFLTNGLPDL